MQTPPLSSPPRDKGAERWLCADEIDWESIRKSSTLATRLAGESKLAAPILTATLTIAVFVAASLSMGQMSVVALSASFGFAGLICAFATVTAQRAVDWQLMQAGILWKQSFERRGSADSMKEVSALVFQAAGMRAVAEGFPSTPGRIDDAIMATVEGLALCHGVNCANAFPPISMDKPSRVERACIGLCLLFCKASGIPEAQRLLPDPGSQERLWRSMMPGDVAVHEQETLSIEVGGAARSGGSSRL